MKDFMEEYGGLMFVFLMGIIFINGLNLVFQFLANGNSDGEKMEFNKVNRPGLEGVDQEGNEIIDEEMGW